MSDDKAVWLEYHEAEIAKRDKRIAELEKALEDLEVDTDAMLAKVQKEVFDRAVRLETLLLELQVRINQRCLCCRVDCVADCACQDKEVPP